MKQRGDSDRIQRMIITKDMAMICFCTGLVWESPKKYMSEKKKKWPKS